MTTAIVVRYETRAEAVAENQWLVEQVFAELAAEDPGGVRYAVFRLADGVGFVHVVYQETDDDPLSRSTAFAEFQHGIGDRLTGPPVRTEATLIGSYGFLSPAHTI
jgi:hypothetical protein